MLNAHPKLHSRPTRRRSATRGIALIEALVAILIFSVGILSLVGLQASMTKAQGNAKFRADAAYLANELVGGLWADMPNMASYASTSATACTYARCADWLGKVARALPQGQATITPDAGTGAITVTVSWTVSSEGLHSYVLQTSVR